MPFNPQPHLNPVQRSVSAPTRDGQPARAVTISRPYAATAEDLWDALTNPERIPRWFLPIEGDLQPGGHYQLTGNAGGQITECEPPSHFALTWEFGGDLSWVEVRLSKDDDRAGDSATRLTLTHTSLHSDNWEQYGPSASGIGWEMALLGLTLHLADPTAPMPDPEAFATSPEGKALIETSGKAWAQAHIESGATPATAQTAATQTIAFYTGATQ